jgi:hypothetical protein
MARIRLLTIGKRRGTISATEGASFMPWVIEASSSRRQGLGGRMQIFVSYARTDRPKVDALSQKLRQAGNDVWLDLDLAGGQVWWDNILHQIRHADAFIAAVSRSSLKSNACQVERRYATQLGKPILPLTVEPVNTETLPTDISRLEIVDYSRPDEATAFRLIGAINRLPPPPPLPAPLPESPDAPSSYWGNIGDQVNAPALDLDQQLAIIGRIEGALAPTSDPAERDVALDLLSQMERRTDLYAAVDRRITLLKQASTGHGDASTKPPDPSPTHGPAAGATAGAGSSSSVHQPPVTPRTAKSGEHPSPPATGASPHWVMAILAIIVFFPTGIPAVVYASRVKPSLAANDLEAARKSSSRVVLFFWISVGIFILYIIGAVAGGSSSSTGAAALASRLWL